MTEAIVAAAGAALAAFLVAWFIRKSREGQDRVRLETQLEEARKSLVAQKEVLDQAQGRLEHTFKALASDTLNSSNEIFLRMANQALESHVKPINEALKVYQEKADALERERQNAYGGLTNLLQSVAVTQEKLKQETGALVSALRRPNVRGQWGEFTLRRVVELAGMTEHCDFSVQESVSDDQKLQRPDLVVHLPNGRDIVVDAKAVADAYFEAQEAASEELRRSALQRHAAHLREQMRGLSSKRYWERFGQAVDFVVLFVPAEPILDAAVQQDPAFIEDAMLCKVIVATPTTLVALLKAVAYGWRQEKLAKNAQEVADQGQKLLEAITVWAGHLSKLRSSIFDVVTSFDAAQGSLERNVLPKVRLMQQLGVKTGKDLPLIEPVNKMPRPVELPRGE